MDNQDDDESRLFYALCEIFFQSLSEDTDARELAYTMAMDAGINSPNKFVCFVIQRLEELEDEKSNNTSEV
jgi:hypothetical protein